MTCRAGDLELPGQGGDHRRGRAPTPSPRFARVTYRQADQLANQVANALLARGLRRGDTCMLFCENSVEALPVQARRWPRPGWSACRSTRRWPRTWWPPDRPGPSPGSRSSTPSCGRGRRAAVRRRGPAARVTIPIGGGRGRGQRELLRLHRRPAGDAEPEVEIHGDDIWEILFTSGTTALPKGVMMSHSCSLPGRARLRAVADPGAAGRERPAARLATCRCIYHVGDQVLHLLGVPVRRARCCIGRRPDPAADRRPRSRRSG